jgi:L-lysine exporter family protein LysE/ArgO
LHESLSFECFTHMCSTFLHGPVVINVIIRSIDAFLLQGLALGITAAASPGPFQAFLINQTLTGGFRRGAPIALAPLIADIPIVITILILLERLPPAFLRGISLAGSAFVLYLAWGLWKQWRLGASAQTSSQPPPSGGLWRGMLMNALSPGPYTFWTLVNGPLLLSALRISWAHGGAFLLGFYGAMISSLVGIAALFHQAQRLGPRMVRLLTLASIIILVIFGGVLLKRGLLP